MVLTITIQRAQVLADMKVKSHAEVASMADPAARYLAELGTEKEQEASQCINDASAEVVALLRPLLSGSVDTTGTDTFDDSSDIVFTLDVTSRKAAGLGSPLAKAIHAYIVDSAMAKYYISVAQGSLAQAHNARLASEITVINELCYRKQDPKY